MPRAPQLSSETEVSIALLCQLCSICYSAIRIKKCLKSTSVLKVAASMLSPMKRNVISIMERFYGSLGFLSPVTVQFKVFMQELCKSGLT